MPPPFDTTPDQNPDEWVREFAETLNIPSQKAEDGTAKPETGGDWRHGLILTEKRKLAACEANAAAVLSRHPAMAGAIWYDDFASRPIFRKPPPWVEGAEQENWRDSAIEDADIASLSIWMQRECGLMVSPSKVATAIASVCREHRFHPVRDYLSTQTWDGVPRIGKWLHTYLHAEDTEYHSAIGARWLIGAVARIFAPGCKLDTALILEGTQGLRKSTAAAVLGGEWFTDEMPDLASKDALQQLQGVWIVELAELSALNKTESNRIKSFMSTRTDRFRPPYGRAPQDFPRQCAFIGTVNPQGGYLKDPTGARRFWVVKCGGSDNAQRADTDAMRRDRDQLWAEAVHLYRARHSHWLDTPELEAAAKEQQQDRYEGDAKDGLIAAWAGTHAKVDGKGRRSVSVIEVLEGALLILDRAKWTQPEQNVVSKCLVSLGWIRKLAGPRSAREWRYFAPTEPSSPSPGDGPRGNG